VASTAGKRGRKAQPPDPSSGPVPAFAHALWQLKLSCDAPPRVPIGDANPGDTAAIEIPVAARAKGACKLNWKMTDGQQRLLLTNKNPVFIDIVVR
jgi:hypothetical protein